MERKAWPYAAGIIDSEGCICISRGHSKEATKAQTGLSIGVGNTDVRLMRWLVENFGGVYKKRPNQRGFSALSGCGYIYGWSIPPTKRTWFLTGIKPYLVLKIGQADLVMRYLSLGKNWNVTERIQLSEECKRLNHQQIDDFYLGQFSTSQEIASYAAGMMDGDGAFYMGMANLNPVVGLTSKSLRSIKWFYKHFGGRINLPPSGGRPYYGWGLSGRRNKERFLLEILPYLMLKREQAKILLEVLRITGKHGLEEERRSFAYQLQALNNKRESVTTETQEDQKSKIQSELTRDRKSDLVETPES